jgi:protocadherin Fat 1/2/3
MLNYETFSFFFSNFFIFCVVLPCRSLAGLIYIVNRLDYEVRSKYELLVRATDSVSGAYSEVPVSVSVEDANDSPPEFSNNEYNVTLSEATPSGTVVLAVSAHDLDSGNNSNCKNKL